MAITLDGFIAGPDGEFDWCFTDNDYGMTEFLESIDSLLMGRKSYDTVADYGAPYPEKMNYVFSRTMKQAKYQNVTLLNEDVSTFASALKRKPGKNIWLFGGTEIFQPLYESDLIDEMHLAIHPIMLGDGIPLYRKGPERNWSLVKSLDYPSGLVQVIYKKL